jgi:hypothetical protein
MGREGVERGGGGQENRMSRKIQEMTNRKSKEEDLDRGAVQKVDGGACQDYF